MPVTPLGNVVIVNQMTPAATSMQNAHTNRVDFQNMAAQVAANEKKVEIEDVRPTEENHAVDPDREHNRQDLDEELSQQGKREKKFKKEDEEEEPNTQSLHHLDIKV